MQLKTYGTLFSGVGGSDLGLSKSGLKGLYAIEWNRSALDILEANHFVNHAINEDVRAIEFGDLPNVDLLWASPVCCNFSNAKHDKEESLDDIECAAAIVRAAVYSEVVIIENVPNYYRSESFKKLSDGLGEIGYHHYTNHRLNAARFGNPSSRDRSYGIFSRAFHRLELPPESRTSWVDELLKYREFWVESKLTEKQLLAIDADQSKPIPGSIYAIERCGYYKYPDIYNRLSPYPTIKSHSHHDGKNPKPGCGKIGSYRSYMDFVYQEQSYSMTPQLLGVMNGFDISYSWLDNRGQAAAGIGNTVVSHMAQILVEGLSFK